MPASLKNTSSNIQKKSDKENKNLSLFQKGKIAKKQKI